MFPITEFPIIQSQFRHIIIISLQLVIRIILIMNIIIHGSGVLLTSCISFVCHTYRHATNHSAVNFLSVTGDIVVDIFVA